MTREYLIGYLTNLMESAQDREDRIDVMAIYALTRVFERIQVLELPSDVECEAEATHMLGEIRP